MEEKRNCDYRKETRVKRFENDYDYPWDERYTMDFGGVESIKRCIDVDGIVTAGLTIKKY